jgi:hypothetical protein
MGGPNDGTSQRSGFYWYWPGAYPNECSCYNDPNSGGGGSGWSTIKHHAHGAVKHQTSYPQMGLEDWSDFDLNHPPPDHSQEYGIYWGRWSYGGAWYNVYERKSCSHYHALEYSNYGDSAENFCCCTNTQEHETYDHSTARADVDINQLDIISSNNECSYKECHGLSGKLYSDCCYGVDGDKGKCTLGYDCTGECGGDAIDCGCGCGYQCNDHNNNGILDCVEECKGILDCAGLCNGGNKYDECGVCSGDNSCLN